GTQFVARNSPSGSSTTFGRPRLVLAAELLYQGAMQRDDAWNLVCQYTASDSLRKHMLAVEAAMRAYAEKFGEDVETWGIVGLLHDFDYERWPDPPDHPLKGAEILHQHGYPEQVIYAIKSHADYLPDCPRVSRLDKALYACDELAGFCTAVALMRPEGIVGMQASSVKKKLKQKSFAAAVSREDITRGAEDLGVPLDEHIQFVIDAMTRAADALGLRK
ncbi:MAG TPA: HD domain-containing protein, partial [Pirellulales bacterium]|nr:HD domain-containing protein [Pirellulales bacterium]